MTENGDLAGFSFVERQRIFAIIAGVPFFFRAMVFFLWREHVGTS